jgi:hypothetical protein
MVEFAKSPHAIAQTNYERRCREANVNPRNNWRQEIEDGLVDGGQEAVDKYKALMDERWLAASCLAEYDGINMGYAIMFRAQARLDTLRRGQ